MLSNGPRANSKCVNMHFNEFDVDVFGGRMDVRIYRFWFIIHKIHYICVRDNKNCISRKMIIERNRTAVLQYSCTFWTELMRSFFLFALTRICYCFVYFGFCPFGVLPFFLWVFGLLLFLFLFTIAHAHQAIHSDFGFFSLVCVCMPHTVRR